ncbi:MAG: ABC transporter ATP-binding protein [Flavobacteriales bacterium]
MDLQVEQLSVAFGETKLFNELSFSLNKGETLCVLGKNGSGKSTLIRQFFDEKAPISWCGKPIGALSKNERSKKFSILYPSQRPHFSMSVTDYIDLGRIPHKRWFSTSHSSSKVNQLLAFFQLEHAFNTSVLQLSDGEFQKVQLIRALNQETEVIFMDEPTAFLDFSSKIELYKLIQNLAKTENKLIIFSSHNINFAWKYADYCLLLDAGKPHQLLKTSELNADLLNQYFASSNFAFNPDLSLNYHPDLH